MISSTASYNFEDRIIGCRKLSASESETEEGSIQLHQKQNESSMTIATGQTSSSISTTYDDNNDNYGNEEGGNEVFYYHRRRFCCCCYYNQRNDGGDYNYCNHPSSLLVVVSMDQDRKNQQRVIRNNFICMSILFSVNHGVMVSCLAFATLNLGNKIGAFQLSLFHLIYALSSVCGATYAVKQYGSRNSMILGMAFYAIYVTLFHTIMTLLLGRQHQIDDDGDDDGGLMISSQWFVNTLTVLGALFGGIGGGIVWTAQGSYFSRSAEEYCAVSSLNHGDDDDDANHIKKNEDNNDVNDNKNDINNDCNNELASKTAAPTNGEVSSYLAGIFAFIYLIGEVACKLLSWIILQQHHQEKTTLLSINKSLSSEFTLNSTQLLSVMVNNMTINNDDGNKSNNISSQWTTVTAMYSWIAITSTVLMFCLVKDYDNEKSNNSNTGQHSLVEGLREVSSWWYKATCAWYLLRHDPKMKYMIGFNAVFGLTGPFVNGYINGEVISQITTNSDRYVGLFSALSSAVAALCSLLFGNALSNNNILGAVSSKTKKGYILMMGSISFSLVVLPFLIAPNYFQRTTSWIVWCLLSFTYTFQGIGRATFESTLRSIFCDYFPNEVEGSYANIILQNGGFTSIGFILSYSIPCISKGYCAINSDDNEDQNHDILVLEICILVMTALSIYGYYKVQQILQSEDKSNNDQHQLRTISPMTPNDNERQEYLSLLHDEQETTIDHSLKGI